jgi:hypothetical protein
VCPLLEPGALVCAGKGVLWLGVWQRCEEGSALWAHETGSMCEGERKEVWRRSVLSGFKRLLGIVPQTISHWLCVEVVGELWRLKEKEYRLKRLCIGLS